MEKGFEEPRFSLENQRFWKTKNFVEIFIFNK